MTFSAGDPLPLEMERQQLAVVLVVVAVGVTVCAASKEYHSTHTNNWAVLVSVLLVILLLIRW